MVSKTLVTIKGKSYPVYSCHEMMSNRLDEDDPVYLAFSAIKLGDIGEIRKCASEMIAIIKRKINLDEKWMVTHCAGEIVNASSCIAQEIAKAFGLEFMDGSLKGWKNEKYYLDMTTKEKENILRKLVYYTGKSLKGKKAILIDDGMTSGVAIKINGEVLLENGLEDLAAFTFLKFKTRPKTLEKEMSKLWLRKEGVGYLIKILRDEQNPIVSRLVSISAGLPPKDALHLLKSIPEKRREELIQKVSVYAKHRSELREFLRIATAIGGRM